MMMAEANVEAFERQEGKSALRPPLLLLHLTTNIVSDVLENETFSLHFIELKKDSSKIKSFGV